MRPARRARSSAQGRMRRQDVGAKCSCRLRCDDLTLSMMAASWPARPRRRSGVGGLLRGLLLRRLLGGGRWWRRLGATLDRHETSGLEPIDAGALARRVAHDDATLARGSGDDVDALRLSERARDLALGHLQRDAARPRRLGAARRLERVVDLGGPLAGAAPLPVDQVVRTDRPLRAGAAVDAGGAEREIAGIERRRLEARQVNR